MKMASKLRRTYLTDNEENLYMIGNCFIEMLEGTRSKDNRIHNKMWEEWQERGMLTPSMKKNIKTAYTYLIKFQAELYENLDEKMQNKIDKKKRKFDFRLVDDFTMQKLFRDMKDRMKYVTLERDNFENIIVDIAQVRCVGCKDDYKNCEICRALEDSLLPYVQERQNCPYAADLSEYNAKEKEHYEKIIKRIESKNQFYKGKSNGSK